MDSQTRITFINGLDTIGGNIISLEKDNFRIITDFGAIGGADISELTDPKNTQILLDKGQLPRLDGVYSKEFITSSDISAYEASPVSTIICLSHLHLDHLGSLGQVVPDIPVFASEEAVHFYHHLTDNGLLPRYPVNWQAVPYDQIVEHGPFSIQFKESDHDTTGACALFIQTKDLKVIHSGDLRLSGFCPHKVFKWVEEAYHFAPDILLLEGTSYSRLGEEVQDVPPIEEKTYSINCSTERSLMHRIKELMVQKDQNLFVIDLYPQNIQRLAELIEVSQECGRTFVLDSAYYKLMSHYLQEVPDSLSYLSQKEDEKAITIDQIRANPGAFLLQVDYERHQVLFDVPVGYYLHSNGMPLGPFMPEYEPYVSSLINQGWTYYHAEVSGHADPQSLLTIAYTIQAQILIPWHTFKPEAYREALNQYGVNAVIPDPMVRYTLTDLLGE